MKDFKMSRNASGYYDETAYKAINEAPKPAEIWTYTTNSGIKKEILIIKNHGTFCTALAPVDEDAAENIEIRGLKMLKYSDPRMVQYIYNSNVAKCITVVSDEDFNDILNEIADALSIKTKCTESPKGQGVDMPVQKMTNFEYFDELVALVGSDAVKDYCRCRYLYHTLNDEFVFAETYMVKLLEMEGGNK